MNPSKERLAIHEAGHSVYAHHLGYPLNHVNINTDKNNGETSASGPGLQSGINWERNRQMEYAISGYVAECIHIDPTTEFPPNSSDYMKIKELCCNIELSNTELSKVFDKLRQSVLKMLSMPDKVQATERLANELISKGHLNGKEATNIIELYTKPGVTRNL